MTKDEIINVVCEVCGTTPGELKSGSIARNVTAARHLIAYHLCYLTLTLSLEEAAKEVGVGRTALYARATPRAIQTRRRTDPMPEFRFWYGQIEARISSKTSVKMQKKVKKVIFFQK